jgi:LytS/YehU family sensor histidine kinase
MISVTIADNGQTPFETINFNTGIGLQNTKERLEQLFGKNQSFSIQPNQPAGTMIDLFLPLQFNAK